MISFIPLFLMWYANFPFFPLRIMTATDSNLFELRLCYPTRFAVPNQGVIGTLLFLALFKINQCIKPMLNITMTFQPLHRKRITLNYIKKSCTDSSSLTLGWRYLSRSTITGSSTSLTKENDSELYSVGYISFTITLYLYHFYSLWSFQSWFPGQRITSQSPNQNP